MFKKQLIFFFLFSNTVFFGQIGGKYVYQFLNLVTSPRQAALGGEVITFYDYDVNQPMFNPASINAEMGNRLALNYGSLYGQVNYGTASYAYTYDRHLQTFYAGINYINYGNIDGYDENGNETSSFTGGEYALSLGYAYNIPYTNFHIGSNLKLISSTLESYSSYGGALDIGGIYIDDKNDINYAIVIRNIGMQFTTYSGINEKLPLNIMMGISQELENVPLRWHLTLNNLQQWNLAFSNPNDAQQNLDGTTTEDSVSFLQNAFSHLIIGAELLPTKGFNIRLGYNFLRGSELAIENQRNFSGLTFGVGLRTGRLKFDYSYAKYTLAGNTSLFGLTINFQEQ